MARKRNRRPSATPEPAVRGGARRWIVAAGATALILVLAAVAYHTYRRAASHIPDVTAAPAAIAVAEAARFVGASRCSTCHAKQAELHQGSDHARAMEAASQQTVLGDFSGARFTQGGVTSSFSKRDGKFVVRTDGPDGRPGEFEVAYTFGVRPLQQYLVPLAGGRLQALGIAWDTRPRAEGGQRWFHLYPSERLRPGDPVHWTGREQTWNYQCRRMPLDRSAQGLRRRGGSLLDGLVRGEHILRGVPRPGLRPRGLGRAPSRRRGARAG